MKILITGGHVTPALALIDELKGHNIVFVGRKYALDHEDSLSLEFKEVTARKIKFTNLITGRFTRLLSPRSLRSLLRTPGGFYQGLKIVKDERPDIIFSFGSYLALPIAFWGWVLKIPVFTHEQAETPGLANRVIGFFAKKIFVSFEAAKKYFPRSKVILSGSPIRRSLLTIIQKPFNLKKDRPVIFFTGGSLGSHSINRHVKNIISQLLKDYIVIHQVGDTKEYDDYGGLLETREKLSKDLQNRYILRKHFLEEEMGYVYFLSDLVVGRAGANTFFELLTLQKPAVFIPLPWAAHKEQEKHAKIFKQAGCAEIFNQSQSSQKLLRLIEKVVRNQDEYRKNFKNLRSYYKKDALKIILKEIFKN